MTGPGSILPFTAAAHRTGQAVLLWSSYAALLWCAAQALNGRPALRRLAWVIFLMGAVVAVIGIMQGGQGNNAYYGLRPVRRGEPFGPYTNRDHAASLMAMSLFAGLGIFFGRFERMLRERAISRRAELSVVLILTAFLLAVIGFGISKTHSRGAIISCVAAAWAVCLLSTSLIGLARGRLAARAGLVCAAAGCALFVFFHPHWIGFVFSTPDSSAAYRLSMYRSGLQIVRDFPLFGVGLGAAQSIFPAYQEGVVQGLVVHVHSDWLELAVVSGVVGVVLYAGALLLFLRRMMRLWLSCLSRELFCLSAGALTAVVAFFLHGFVDFSFQIPANAVVFLALLCLLEGSLRFARKPEADVPEQAPLPRPLSVRRAALALLPLGLMALALRPAVASWYRFSAEEDSPASGQAALLAKASAWKADPEFQCRSAQALFAQAETCAPQRRTVLLREGLAHARGAQEAEPYNPGFRQMTGAILSRLGRPGDGS